MTRAVTARRSAGHPLVLAHRGDWTSGPDRRDQNSLAAILAAVDGGCDGAEIDVRRTADGALVLHHDPHLGAQDARAGCSMRGGSAIVDLPAASLGHLAVLVDVVEALADRGHTSGRGLVLNVELKDLPGEPGHDDEHVLARDVAALLVAARVAPLWTRSTSSHEAPGIAVVVSSFDPGALDAVRAAGPGVQTGLLVAAEDDQEGALARAAEADLTAVHLADGAITADLVDAARSAGLGIAAWTVDDPERARVLSSYGVDVIISNYPFVIGSAVALC